MATEKLKQYNNYTARTVGNINSWKIRTLPHGAKATEDIDNFTIGQLGFDAEGQRTVSQLAAVDTKGYLVATPERRYMNEKIDEFFNGQDDYARIIYLDEGLRFETSGYSLDATVTEVAAGNSAHFDPATKEFIIHDGTHADFATAVNKFTVVGNEEDMDYTLGHALVQLEVQ